MRLHPASAALLLLVAMTPSCGEGLTGPRKVAQQELNAARARWAALEVANYDYEYRMSCFCGPDALRPVVVQVRGGMVTAVRDRETDEPRTPLTQWATIPGLFDRIQGWIDLPANTLDVEYDPVSGIPTSVSVDPIRNAVDDEGGFHASALVALEP